MANLLLDANDAGSATALTRPTLFSAACGSWSGLPLMGSLPATK
jgi:hypothetical protein